MLFNINLSEMKQLREKSHYNYNFYAYGNMGLELLQVWHEENDTCDYYLISGDSKVLLGSADGCDENEVDFMYKYT